MRLTPWVCLVTLVLCPYVAYGQQVAPEAEWTVMAWLNGDNNLQDYILGDWKEMAWVGSGEKVNIIVQLDLQGQDDTRRFRIATDKENNPKLTDATRIAEANMVSGDELAAFVSWTREHYPAKRYAFVLSSHGSGWREFKVSATSTSAAPATVQARAAAVLEEPEEEPPPDDEEQTPQPPKFLPEGTFGSPNRALNGDDNSTGDALYNIELAQALEQGMAGRPFDVIALDACLMGMVEVAYGLRKAGRVLVSSEELVHSFGFNHSDWVRQLRTNAETDAQGFGRLLVRSYDTVHTRRIDPQRTLSAFDLTTSDELARTITTLSEALIANIATEKKTVKNARKGCTIYALNGCDKGTRSCFFHVDLKRFTDELARLTTSDEVRAAATRVSAVLQRGVIDRYAGAARQGSYGSAGLAIYFPDSRNDFLFDHLQQRAYFKANTTFPVEFVTKAAWADFLHVYHLGAREAQPCVH